MILITKITLLEPVSSAHEIVVTPIVEAESTRLDSFDARLIRRFVEESKIFVRPVRGGGRDIRRLQKDFNIAEGEASSLYLARRLEAALATDDGRTIKAARVFSVRFVTAIHLLLECYRRGHLSRERALSKLEKLEVCGRYHPRILENAKTQLAKGAS